MMILAELLTAAACFVAGDDPKIDVAALELEECIKFKFDYEFELEKLPAGARKVRVWIPVPRRDAVQDAEIAEVDSPAALKFTQDAEYGNRIAYCEVELKGAPTKPLRWRLSHQVTRRQWPGPIAPEDAAEPDAAIDRYLAPDKLVPKTGFITDVAKDLGIGDTDASKRGRELYGYCLREMTYKKDGTGWGRGDVKWACDAKYGNCSDFHSLFISLCRVRGIPAKFEIGFPLPYPGEKNADAGEITGYHCWAKFIDPDAGWQAVDISEASKHPELTDYFYGRLHARRIHLSTGRDITLSPKQDGPPVNFLVYPYVEIDGKEHTSVKRRFAFEIVGAKK